MATPCETLLSNVKDYTYLTYVGTTDIKNLLKIRSTNEGITSILDEIRNESKHQTRILNHLSLKITGEEVQ